MDRVKDSAGIPEDKARSAVDAVVGYVKDKYPTVGKQLEGFVHGGEGGGGLAGNIGDKLGLK